MTIGQELAQELLLEASVTRRYLQNVPFDRLNFKPAETSETLGRLAVHVAEIMAWVSSVVNTNKLDFIDFEPKKINSSAELLLYFDTLLNEALIDLKKIKNDEFEKEWSMNNGEEIYFTLPKKQVLRVFCINHLIHHRAQLSVYLRLLNIPVPATYGPSADDFDVILVNKYQTI